MLAVLIGVAGLLPVLLSLPEAVDRLLVMHRLAAAAFVLGGSAMFALASTRERVGIGLLLAMIVLAGVNLIAYSASARALLMESIGLTLSSQVQMAPMTAALFLATGATMLLCRLRGAAAIVPAAIILVLCVALVGAVLIRVTVAGDYWPVLASVTPHSASGHALLALGSFAGVLVRGRSVLRNRQARLALGTLMLLTVAAVITVGILSWRDYRATVREVETETANLARLFEEHAHRRLDPVLLLLHQVVDDAASADAIPPLPQMGALLRFDASGILQLLAGPQPDGEAARELIALARGLRDRGDDPRLVSGAHLHPLVERPDQGFALALEGRSGSVAIALFEAAYFRSFYERHMPGEEGSAALFRDDGEVLVLQPPVAHAGARLRTLLFDDYRGVSSASFIDRGQAQAPEHFVAFRRSSSLPFFISASVALTPAIRHFEARLQTALFTMLGMLVVLGGAAQLQMRAIRRQDETQAELQQSRDFTDAVLNSMASHIAILDPKGEIVATNRAWQMLRRASGCSDQDRSQLSRCEVCRQGLSGSGVAERAAEGISSVRAGQKAAFLLTYPCEAFGVARWFNLRVTPFAGRPGYVVVSHEDVTELKEVEQALDLARCEAEAANAAKTRFLANMSHEIRTPLTAVLGMTRLLASTVLDQRQRDYVRTTEAAGEALLAIISDILDLSKIEAGRIELERAPFALRRLLDDVLALFNESAVAKGLGLVLDVDDGVPDQLVGDRVRLQQVLMNLLGNALKFTERGRVVLAVSLAPGALPHICFSVKDTGIGMDDEQIARVFHAFVQGDSSTARRYGGTGLGLSISRRLVQLMGGILEVDSLPGAGSCFSFALPLALSAPLDGPLVVEATRLDGLRLLVVEDNDVNRMLAVEVLEMAGAKVDTAADGQAALGCLERGDGLLDAVLMDVQMPGLDGLEATRLIRAMPRYRRLPIIAMTANAMGSERTQCLEAGMDDYVSKPLDIDRLLQVVRRTVDVAFAAGRLPASVEGNEA
ncbi:ATP-binding protein [Thauera mechernichensis]